MPVTLSRASTRDYPMLRKMAAAYLAELRPFYAPGVTPPETCADMWLSAQNMRPLMMRLDGRVVGFIVLLAQDLDYYLAEFFTVADCRQSTVAMQAIAHLARSCPGKWSADVLAANTRGQRLVRSMGKRYARDMTEIPFESSYGPAIRFRFVL